MRSAGDCPTVVIMISVQHITAATKISIGIIIPLLPPVYGDNPTTVTSAEDRPTAATSVGIIPLLPPVKGIIPLLPPV